MLHEARQKVAEFLCEGMAIANEPKIEKLIEVEWSSRMTSTAGFAWWRKNGRRVRRLQFSAVIMPYVPEEEMRQMALHELAHLVSYERYAEKGAGHGRNWKRTMRELGARPERLHTYHRYPAVIAAAGFPAVVCLDCGQVRGVTKLKAKRMRQATYTHGDCKSGLRVMSPEERKKFLDNALGGC